MRPNPNKPAPPPMYQDASQVTVELGVDTPPDIYTLVIYKVGPDGVRSVANGTPDAKRAFTFSTGGKQCSGGFETIYAGERIAVAWLDVHGRISARSAVITAGAAKP